MQAYERLLKYAEINTMSDEDKAASTPSTACQHELAELLEGEMRELGLEGVYRDEHCYVYGKLPASPGFGASPTIGLIAHIDTAPDFSGENVKPRIVENYQGGDIELGHGRRITTEKFPDLTEHIGQDIIVTDGSTLLGADDKAGIAEILTACERLINEHIPHCAVSVCFCPDEEIGHGAELMDLRRLGADFAYTLDGGAVEELSYETFNACSAVWEIQGVNVHPGSAKDIMVNASLVAMEINSLLPPEEIPAKTEGYQGFFHLTDMKGNCEKAELKYIVRDHDAGSFRARQELLGQIEKRMKEKYGPDSVKLSITQQYKNMAEVLRDKQDIVLRAERALKKQGLTPDVRPIRGGTDGSQLSFRGLPCPNLGTGGYGFHGPYEHISTAHMDTMVEVVLNLLGEK